MATTTSTATISTEPPTTISLRVPFKYLSPGQQKSSTPAENASFIAPPPEWLHRTWSVTHSTLPMWRTERNVRITYTPRPPRTGSPPLARNCDLVEYEAASGKGGIKSVSGGNTAVVPPGWKSSDTITNASTSSSSSSPAAINTGSWDWRGKSWLFWVTSHWEVLGWGERPLPDGGVERWAVTWFSASIFTPEGVDIYSDRKEGLSRETADGVIKALKELPAKELAAMCEKDLRPVEIKLPWKER